MWPHLEDTVRIWPHLNEGEGHFVAKLRLKEAINSDGVPKQKTKKAKKGKNMSNDGLNKEQQKVMQDFTSAGHFLLLENWSLLRIICGFYRKR